MDINGLISDEGAILYCRDNQSVTIRHTRYQWENANLPHPHQAVIDLGRVHNFRFLG